MPEPSFENRSATEAFDVMASARIEAHLRLALEDEIGVLETLPSTIGYTCVDVRAARTPQP